MQEATILFSFARLCKLRLWAGDSGSVYDLNIHIYIYILYTYIYNIHIYIYIYIYIYNKYIYFEKMKYEKTIYVVSLARYVSLWCFSIAAPELWNSLPQEVCAQPSLHALKTALKTELFQAHCICCCWLSMLCAGGIQISAWTILMWLDKTLKYR